MCEKDLYKFLVLYECHCVVLYEVQLRFYLLEQQLNFHQRHLLPIEKPLFLYN